MPVDPVHPSLLRPEKAVRACVLALDTTAGACSVAVVDERVRASTSVSMTQGHSRHLLRLVNEVLSESGLSSREIGAIAFGSGPGSFTGLRVACGVAQGLALGWGLPVIGVDALTSLAWQAAQAAIDSGESCAQDLLLVALDLRMQEVAHTVFRLGDFDLQLIHERGAWPSPVLPVQLGSAQAAVRSFEQSACSRVWLAGDGFDAHALLADWVSERGVSSGIKLLRPESAIQPQAWSVARLAQIGEGLGQAVDAARASPFYLRDKVALDVDEQAAVRAARNAARAG